MKNRGTTGWWLVLLMTNQRNALPMVDWEFLTDQTYPKMVLKSKYIGGQVDFRLIFATYDAREVLDWMHDAKPPIVSPENPEPVSAEGSADGGSLDAPQAMKRALEGVDGFMNYSKNASREEMLRVGIATYLKGMGRLDEARRVIG